MNREIEQRDPRLDKRKSYGRKVVETVLYGSTTWLAAGTATSLAGGSDKLTNKIGTDVGLGMGLLLTGTNLADHSHKNSIEHAIQGNTKRAVAKSIQAGIERAGLAGVFSIPALEFLPAPWGPVVTVATGSLWFLSEVKGTRSIRAEGEVYNKFVIPARDAENYKGLNIANHRDFPPSETVFLPPVYRALTFKDLKDFRQAQIDASVQASKSMSGVYKQPDSVINLLSQAIFILPDVKNRNTEGSSEEMILVDHQGNKVNVKVYPRNTKEFWPQKPLFYDDFNSKVDTEKWDKFKKSSWAHSVVILADRFASQKNELGLPDPTAELKVSEEYYLIGTLKDPSASFDKRRPRGGIKTKRKILGPIPNPLGI